jgi:hypothetical protein
VAIQPGVYTGVPPSALVALGSGGGREAVAFWRQATGTFRIGLADCNTLDVTLTGNITWVMPVAQAGRFTSFSLIVRQDGTGSRTLTWPSTTTLIWAGGAAPTASTAASSVDCYVFWSVTGRVWHGAQVGKGYA